MNKHKEKLTKETKETVQLIREKTKGRFFVVEFIKRTDGTLRKMVCRLGVRKHLRGGTLRYDPNTKGLIVVWDSQKQDYRQINLLEIQSFRIGNYNWKNPYATLP